MQRSAVPAEGIEFVDRYGETRVIHHNQSPNGPLRVKRTSVTPALAMNPVAAKGLGRKVRAHRLNQGYTLLELANRAGLTGGKQAIWQIENALRAEGVRLGTLYALAFALNVEVVELLPSRDEVVQKAGVTETHRPALAVVAESVA